MSETGPRSFKPVRKSAKIRLWTSKMLTARHDPVSVAAALENAIASPGLEWLVTNLGDKTYDFAIGMQDLVRWCEFWERPELAWENAADLFMDAEEPEMSFCEAVRVIQDEARAFMAMPAERRARVIRIVTRRWTGRKVSQFFRICRKVYDRSLEQIMAEIIFGELPSPEADRRFDADPLPGLFIVRVAVPAFLRFGQSPRDILDRARAGDRQALARLQTLDTNARHLPGVAERINALVLSRAAESWQNELRKAAFIRSRNDPRQWSKMLAIAVTLEQSAVFAEGLPGRWKPLTLPEIVDLHNAVACDRNPKIRYDEDLHDDPAALRKQVQRARTAACYLQWDISKCFRCPS